MNKIFYIFRHGQTDWNTIKRCQGHTNTDLNQIGIIEANNLAEKMASIPLEIMYSSDLSRAFNTAKIVAEKRQLKIVTDPRLREMDYGEAEGMLVSDIKARYGEDFFSRLHSFKKSDEEIGFPGGESRKKSRERLEGLIQEIIANTDYQHIGIATHGGALRNILHHYLPLDAPVLPIPNCVLYRMIYSTDSKTFLVETTAL